ncbi:hypothetical protein GOEFS_118_00110 [Gordonia effusa NBRC 100432]|uniref:YcxB-like protein domain-containing protein n=1 Tax=Gordonia effusa NBRC 100432 TaxID=1077974 RepID=H0R606_9ACTN|nr:hypothetical protein [Gordonia effusa]GAB20507.1 hypothetical protein GOEFS_118_00110 [Gordonia effusa NBRC 100432]
MTFNMGDVAPISRQPFPALTAPQAVAYASLADVEAMAKEAARRHIRTPQYLLIPISFAVIVWSITAHDDPIAALVVAVCFLPIYAGLWFLIAPRTIVPTFSALLAGDCTSASYTFAASFDATSMDIATHEVSITRMQYHSIKHLYILNTVVLVRADARVLFVFPRALLSPETVNRLRTAGVRIHS